MPYLRRVFRRFSESQMPTRMVAHLSVVGLVTLASAAGIAQAQGTGGTPTAARVDPGFPTFVSSVRGAAGDSVASTPSIYSLTAHPADDEAAVIDRGAPAHIPSEEPLPTPYAIDPDATPIPGPEEASTVASSETAGAPSARGAAPAAPARTALVWPVPSGSVSQPFHAGHLAVDIAAPYGAQVVAAQAGVVTSVGWRNNGGGNVISIDHGNGMVTVYNHLGAFWVSSGQYVAAGQGIGAVGCTGICTGPHVHFEVIVNGVIDNPQRYF